MSKKYKMTQEELKLFKDLQDKRKRQTEALDFSMKGAIRGTEEIYPETAHFVYELLQNADDCGATEATFILSSNKLIFKHNGGEHFSITPDREDVHPYGHVNSITAYCSTKNSKEGQIGKFGIGFKSVYQYTDTPYIYDDVFKFMIEDRMIPYLLDNDHPERKEGETLFDLQFKSPSHDYEEINERLHQLQDPVLFLPHIRKINWHNENTGEQSSFERYERFIGEWDETKCNLTTVINDSKIERLYVFSKFTTIPDQNKTVEIKVGYYLDNHDCLDVDKRPNTYCFFPTAEKYHMCFVAHAPFLLTNNRAGIRATPINTYLHQAIADLASNALVALKEIGENNKQLLIDDNLFKIISLNIEIPCVFRDSFVNTVQRNQLILSRNRNYLGVDDALKGDSEELEALLSKEQLAVLYPNKGQQRDFIFIKKDKRNDIDNVVLMKLGIDRMDSERFALRLTSAFLNQQDDVWINRFYDYIEKHARQLWNKQEKKSSNNLILRGKPIVKTSTGDWVRPYNPYDDSPEVFLPMDSIKSLRGEKYQFVDSSILEKHKSFFISLGLNQPNYLDFVNLDIIPKYSSRYMDDPDDATNLEDFVQLINICRNSNDEVKLKIQQALYRKYKLKATDGEFHQIYELYDDTSLLHDYYGDRKAYLDYSFYSNNKSGLSKNEVREFVVFLGIHKELTIIKKDDPNYRLISRYDISERRPAIWWEDYELDGFGRYLVFSKEKSHIMWNFLCGFDKNTLDIYMRASCYGYQNYSYVHQTFSDESTLLRDLIETAWICKDDKSFCTPSAITKSDFLSFGYGECECITSKLHFKVEKPKQTSLKELGATKEQQADEELGKRFREKGGSLEDLDDYFAWKELRKEELRHAVERESTLLQTENHHNQSHEPKSSEISTTLDARYGSSKQNNNEVDKGSHEKSTGKTRSKDLESFVERQRQRIETECKKEDLLEEMQRISIYTKEWFLHGLKYEYLNSKDTGKEQISHSISISFTNVVPEHSNVYKFCNPSKPIPRWLEEIDGDIKVDFRFKNGDGVQVNFAMACVQDFSIRLRAKGNDEEVLNQIVWDDLSSADLDINNPRGLVKNLFDAFKNLPFDDNYDFKANLKGNVQFIFGPPGTGKTTSITQQISSLIQENSQCRILVLAPTNQACDVITKELMKQNPNYQNWLGRFVATNDETIEQEGVVCSRDSLIYSFDRCCIVSTMARLSYDYFENVEDGKHCLKDMDWDYIICDEGSMISLPEMVYTIYKFSYDDNVNFTNKPIIIAGDPKQLQPIDSSGVWAKRSIYDMVNLDSFEKPTTTPIQFKITNLDTQHRAVPAIGELFSRYSYNGLLKHKRTPSDLFKLNIAGLEDIKPVTYMPFLVDNYDDIYGAKRMAGSNVHIYSAIITAELCRYIAVEYDKGQSDKPMKIGVICPYIAQVQLIDKLLGEYKDMPMGDKVNITVGTIHSFQGDECNVIFALFNPPKGMTSKRQESFTMLLNDDHLVNVAISRAKDYLFIMVPTPESYGRENLTDINRVADILLDESNPYPYSTDVGLIDCSKLERLLFGEIGYLKQKSYITAHQMANVYTPTGYIYDIRIDENAIDIQIGENDEKTS